MPALFDGHEKRSLLFTAGGCGFLFMEWMFMFEITRPRGLIACFSQSACVFFHERRLKTTKGSWQKRQLADRG